MQEIEKLTNRLTTAESQIEKDWSIIESQSQQLENLHQQFIEQRDENIRHRNMVKDKDEEMKSILNKLDKLQQVLVARLFSNSQIEPPSGSRSTAQQNGGEHIFFLE